MKDFFVSYVYQNFSKDQASTILSKIDWDTWFYGKGLPPVTANFYNDDVTKAHDLAADYISKNGTASPKNYEDFKEFYTNQ